MNADVATWLKHPADFAAGVQLYEQLGSSATYKKLFAVGETGYSRQLLVRELQALATAAPAARPSAAPMVPPAPVAAAAAPMPVNEEALQQLRDRKKACRDERDRLRAHRSCGFRRHSGHADTLPRVG